MNLQPQQPQFWRLESAAHLAGLPARRVRRYVQVGLIRPARVEGMTDLFGQAELARLRRIRRLVDDLGINLAGIEVVLRLVDELAALRSVKALPDSLPARAIGAPGGNGRGGSY